MNRDTECDGDELFFGDLLFDSGAAILREVIHTVRQIQVVLGL